MSYNLIWCNVKPCWWRGRGGGGAPCNIHVLLSQNHSKLKKNIFTKAILRYDFVMKWMLRTDTVTKSILQSDFVTESNPRVIMWTNHSVRLISWQNYIVWLLLWQNQWFEMLLWRNHTRVTLRLIFEIEHAHWEVYIPREWHFNLGQAIYHTNSKLTKPCNLEYL